MSKKLILCFTLLTLGMWVLSCVSPFYSTARIDKGWHTDAGLAALLALNDLNGPFVRGDIGIRYGFNDHFQINGRVGIVYTGGDELPVTPVACLGMQVAAPLGVVTPALGVEVSFSAVVTPTFLLGIGQNEWLTLGGRVHIFHPQLLYPPFIPDAFITGHLWSRLSIFASVGLLGLEPLVTLGVGYKIK